MSDRTARLILVGAIVLGAALRFYPLQVRFLHPDQELLPALALRAFANGDWDPRFLVYPSGFITLLRATYTVAWAGFCLAGRAGHDRLEMIDAFLGDPFPFLVAARLWSCAFGVAMVALGGILGHRLLGAGSGAVAGVFLALSFLGVRESHYGSIDAAAAALFTATLVGVAGYAGSPSRRRLVWAGVLAGLTAAFRYQLGIVALALPVAVLLTPGGRLSDLVLAAAASAIAFTAGSPYALLRPLQTWHDMHAQLAVSWADARFLPPGLPLPAMIPAAVGPAVAALAAIGIAASLRARARAIAPVLAATVPYAVILLAAPRAFLRYVLPLVPVLCVFGAAGVRAVAELVPARIAPTVAALLVLTATADPALRSFALDRLLAVEDTRVAAGRWLAAHHPIGAPLWLPTRFGYSDPAWGTALPRTRAELREYLKPLAKRNAPGAPAYPVVIPHSGMGAQLGRLERDGGVVVIAEHPLVPQWAWTEPRVTVLVRTRGKLAARFDAIDPDVAPADVGYEPIDANFVPLRGFAHVRAPGPNITVWWVSKSPPSGLP